MDFTASSTVIESGDADHVHGHLDAWRHGLRVDVRRRRHGDRAAPRSTRTPSTAGSPFTVSLTVTYPDPIGAVTTTKPGYITVNPGKCTVPSPRRRQVQQRPGGRGTRKGFTGYVARALGAPGGNFTIHVQSQTASFKIPCDSDVEVKDK